MLESVQLFENNDCVLRSLQRMLFVQLEEVEKMTLDY